MFSDYVATALDDLEQVDTIYLYFAKAFDRVRHVILVSKLSSFEFSGSVLKVLCFYIKDRTHAVKIKGAILDRSSITSSVQQC